MREGRRHRIGERGRKRESGEREREGEREVTVRGRVLLQWREVSGDCSETELMERSVDRTSPETH